VEPQRQSPDAYPVQFSVQVPGEPRNRLTTAFRIFIAIPILIVLAAIGDATVTYSTTEDTRTAAAGSAGLLFLPTLLMIVFRQKYPRWWFDFNRELARFENRVIAYVALLRDEYPSTDEQQAVTLEIPYPDVPRDLNRWLPLVKWLLAIPHFIVLIVLSIGAVVAVIIAWFAILFTGNYPQGLFDYVVGFMRWGNRVAAYAFLLVTDEYPPFRLSP
jgi:hypothetical protein